MHILGNFVQQPEGFKAFIPAKFPPNGVTQLDSQAHKLLNDATFSLGKLDGITELLPDLSFFIFMYVRKEASHSSQIEGTQATMSDALKAESDIQINLPKDVDDILHYIDAMNFGLERLSQLPLSLRLLKEVHQVLLTNARTEHHVTPGEFRRSQNWIGGASPATAKFVPPPISNMMSALGDLEDFIHQGDHVEALIKAALIHAQFETIHPFVDGNGRTGRLLITFFLCQQNILKKPVLYLSEFFKKHRTLYFDMLDGYHTRGEVLPWIKFFLEGILAVSEEAIETSRKITVLREKDIEKVYTFGRNSNVALGLLKNLFKQPIVTVKKVEEFTGLARPNANKLVDKFVRAGILFQIDKVKEYGRTFSYRNYLDIFEK